ncbi:OmpA family protein [candidate division KSB1 bacterium]|nr:OmpA family protein [candidate division KSB1 bacterium]
MKINVRTVLCISLLVVVTGTALAMQDDVKARIFKDINEMFAKARSEQADLLSPTVYQQAVKKNEQAVKNFEKGKSPEPLIEETNVLLRTAIENAKLSKVTFPHTLAARTDALQASAPQLTLDLYTKAERELTEAAKSLEKGDMKKSKEQGLRAEKMYRDAELAAIKLNVLGEVTQKSIEAKDTDIPKYTPLTYARVVKLLEDADELLQRDRSAIPEARAIVEDAAYELSHAAYIVKRVLELKGDDTNWERLILEHEAAVTEVVKEFNYEPKFDQGMQRVTASLITAINSMKQDNRRLNDELTQMSKQNETLQDEIDQTKSELNASKEVQAGLKARIDSDRKKEEKYKKAEDLFLAQEAKVLRIGDELTLRLIGLNFPSGRATIEPAYFSLLSKVQRAIRLFPDYHVIVEGHTDAVGDDRYNQRLSMQRADAVRAYILASMGLPSDQVTAMGYGESRPIASNETNSGRRQNRRIDIVLKPQK